MNCWKFYLKFYIVVGQRMGRQQRTWKFGLVKQKKEKKKNLEIKTNEERKWEGKNRKIWKLVGYHMVPVYSIMFVLYLFWLWKNVLFFKGCIITVAEFGVCFNIKKYRKEFWPGHQHFLNYMLHFSTLWKINFFLKSLSNPACFTIEFWIHQSFSC